MIKGKLWGSLLEFKFIPSYTNFIHLQTYQDTVAHMNWQAKEDQERASHVGSFCFCLHAKLIVFCKANAVHCTVWTCYLQSETW